MLRTSGNQCFLPSQSRCVVDQDASNRSRAINRGRKVEPQSREVWFATRKQLFVFNHYLKTQDMESTGPVSLTSLLNSLHSHLQQQTQLLPALHSQLGLPHTSLADELSALEQELTTCVERQIDLRRKQVDQWMEKCALVENDCARYSKALGGHIKVTGSGIGELRKEHVLPRRYDALAEHQERLRQVSTIPLLDRDRTDYMPILTIVIPLKTRTVANPHK